MDNREKLKIGGFVLDPLRNVLIGESGECSLEPKVVDLLQVLATSAGSVVSRDELIDAVWNGEFGADERLTRTISQLRKALGDERGTPRYIETISKRGYRLIAAVEIALDGATRLAASSLPPGPASIPKSVPNMLWPKSRPWSRTALGAAAVVTLCFCVVSLLWWPAAKILNLGHGVLEIRPLSVIGGQWVEGERMAQKAEQSLRLILSANNVLLLDGKARSAFEFSLQGSIEQLDAHHAINLYLIKANDGQTLWSHRFVRSNAELESLRDEAAANTAFTMNCALKARDAAKANLTIATFKKYFESCDPTKEWAARLAIAHVLIMSAPHDAYGHGLKALASAFVALDDLEFSKSELYRHRVAARKAIARTRELDPDNELARTAELVLATVNERWRDDDALQRASDRHPRVLALYFGMLRSSGRLKEARHIAERAVAMQRLSPVARNQLAVIYMQQGEYQEASRQFDAALRLWPDDASLRFYQLINESFYGSPARAVELLDRFPDRWLQVCYRAFLEARRSADPQKHLPDVRRACTASAEYESQLHYLARILAVLGDVDSAYEVLSRRALDWNGATIALFYPELDTFRKDARFMPFIAKSGLLEAWNETGHWPDFCSDLSLPYDCKTEAAKLLK